MKEKYSFNPGDKIFAKVKGFVYWPARVNPIPDEIVLPPNKIPIFFFGTHEVFFIAPSSCWPYDEKHKAKWGKPRSRAHFNQGMDEIENNSTLFQYGVDPEAEEFLAQFYEFKRSSDVKSSKFSKLVKHEKTKIETNNETSKSHDELISTINVKKNKNLKNKVVEQLEEDAKAEEVKEGIKMEELKEDVKEEVIDERIILHSEIPDTSKPILRSKSLSSSKQSTKRKSTVDRPESKSDDGSDSEKVSSDNPNDEDFEPVKKTARVSRPSLPKTPKPKKNETKPKRVPKSKPTPKTKKSKPVASDIDSLSSISSIEDWQAKDEKRRKEHEESLKMANKEDLIKEELAIKEASKKARRKSQSQTEAAEECNKDTEKVQAKSEVCEDKNKSESTLIGKEVIVEISIRDIGKSDIGDEATMISAQKISDKVDLPVSDIPIICKTDTDNVKHDFTIQGDVSASDIIVINEDKKMDMIEESDVSKAIKIDAAIKPSKSSQNKKQKPSKKERVSTKKEKSSKKRKIHSDDSEEETIERKTKKSKLTRFIDSDVEMIDCDIKDASQSPRNVTLESGSLDSTVDKVKSLLNYNIDIRSSLVLGHEDYQKCIDRFKTLCTMDIDVITLVSVWQLMDTVKKCRRYKRNESVKTEAQNAYKRFMDIYSNSTADEIVKAQAMLAKCRNSHSEAKFVGNGQSQNPTMPTSVADMFHNKSQPSNAPEKKQDQTPIVINTTATTTVANISDPLVAEVKPRPKQETDDEKMRLLSADLESKVNDILNKIEKNTFSNPINQKSMSHLLPSSSEHSVINLPVEWESVDNRASESRLKSKVNKSNSYAGNGVDDDDDDDDEDDVDAIVKRIEDVPIKQIEDVTEGGGNGGGGGLQGATSALDARIENLFNNSFSASVDVAAKATKKQRSSHKYSHKSSSGKHSTFTVDTAPKINIVPKLPVEVVVAAAAAAVAVDTVESIDLTEQQTENKSADTVIYDLLGV